MESNFVERAALYSAKEDFEKVVRACLNDIFGETCASSIIFHMGGPSVLRQPKEFEEKIKDVFGIGADLILSYVLKHLENPKKHSKRQ